jgi:hypothetical protein
MKIAVIVSDATAMVHTGAELYRTVRVFDLPKNISDYIAQANSGSYTTISLSVVDEAAAPERDGGSSE